MRISSKGRYALAAMVSLAQNYSKDACITVISISKSLGISKIYLEQVFSLLKRSGLVSSVKGAQGGYRLARMPKQITAYDVLSGVELFLFEAAGNTVSEKAPHIDAALRLSAFTPLDRAVEDTLKGITLYDLAAEADRYSKEQGYMFYI